MHLQLFTVNPFQQNTFLIIHEGKALLFDAGFADENELKQLRDALQKHKAELAAVVLTHAHIDHVAGLQLVLNHFEVPVYMSHEDLFLWEHAHEQAGMYGIKMEKFGFTPREIRTDTHVEIAGLRMLALFTPGHSPDHLSFYLENEKLLIAGDALFKDSIGRTDLYKGDFNQLASSIREKLYVLPDDTRVLPGHGPETTIGREKSDNQFVRA